MMEKPNLGLTSAGPGTDAADGQLAGQGRITGRAIVGGLLFLSLIIAWIAHTELSASAFLSSCSIIMPAVLLLFLIVPLNALLARCFPGLALTRCELLLGYILIGVSVVLTGYGMLQVLIPVMGSSFYFATPENRWAELHYLLPHWLTVRDPAALKGLFQGESAVPWTVWLLPLAAWFSFLLAFVGLMLCHALLLSRQWITAERLTFPVVALPLEMTAPRAALFRNRAMWIGFVIPALLNTAGVLHYWYPTIPDASLGSGNYGKLFVTAPWNGIGTLWVTTHPFVVALAYLPPADISFSVWFFFLIGKLLRVVGVYMGWSAPYEGESAGSQQFPYPAQQSSGAFLAFGLFVLWKGYPGLRQAVASAWRREGDVPEEVPVNRWAVAGIGFFGLYLIGFLYLAGMSLHWALLLVAFCMLVAIVLARLRAETGTPWAYGLFGLSRDAGQTLVATFGPRNFSPSSLATVGLTQWFYMDPRFLPMAHHIEALKMGDSARMRRGKLAALILLASAVGILVGYWACLTVSYKLGIATAKVYSNTLACAVRSPTTLADWLTNRTKPELSGLPWVAGSALFTIALICARQAFVWWPFHPIGYVVSETGTPYYAWSQYFLGWFFKAMVLRYGGMKLYARSVPFVIGVIMGHIVSVTAWSFAGWLFKLPLSSMM
ncbi:MAG: hypothetical protein IT210_25185 [Armatimonadetes bacterium]|nr:hypothetical protein [Armatimonadota bacterium]